MDSHFLPTFRHRRKPLITLVCVTPFLKRFPVAIVSRWTFIWKRLPVSFIKQIEEILLLKSITVREALLFSAKLRQPSSVPLAEKEA